MEVQQDIKTEPDADGETWQYIVIHTRSAEDTQTVVVKSEPPDEEDVIAKVKVEEPEHHVKDEVKQELRDYWSFESYTGSFQSSQGCSEGTYRTVGDVKPDHTDQEYIDGEQNHILQDKCIDDKTGVYLKPTAIDQCSGQVDDTYTTKIKENLAKYNVYRCSVSNHRNESRSRQFIKKHVRSTCPDAKSMTYKCLFTDCTFRTHVRPTLEHHMLSHLADSGTNVDKFKCPYTDCKFNAQSTENLQRHLSFTHINPDIKIYQCPYPNCRYRTLQAECLKKHITLEHSMIGRSGFECPHEYCEYKTEYKQNLKVHIESKHPRPESSVVSQLQECKFRPIRKLAKVNGSKDTCNYQVVGSTVVKWYVKRNMTSTHNGGSSNTKLQ